MCFATPVMRQVAFIETPSTKAEATCTRRDVGNLFIFIRLLLKPFSVNLKKLYFHSKQ